MPPNRHQEKQGSRIGHVDRSPRAPPPYTFIVMGVVIVLLGVFAIVTTPTDLFPEIDIPVVSVIWN